MQLSAIFLGLGEESFSQLLRGVSIGKLKTYQLYDRMKARMHLAKLNSEHIRKAEPRLWARLAENDEDFATDLSQAILVSHLDMIKAVLDDLGVPNQDGFFDKNIDAAKYLTEGWQQKSYDKFKAAYPKPLLLFYINHLDWELAKSENVFQPQA
jgi:inorganic triphosphatase YgiF